tara:strand:- start:2619 stop:3320 length:702 start_codon:yes stop_codon:yes gene_type:complete
MIKNLKNIQLLLNLKKKNKIYEKNDFLISASNKEAFNLINRWPKWISRKLVLYGDTGLGKTHLSNIWKKKTSALNLSLKKFQELKLNNCFLKNNTFIVENITKFFEEKDKKKKEKIEKKLLHFYNLIDENKSYLLITSLVSPRSLNIILPDLKSRIMSSMSIKIKKPDDELLSLVLIKLFSDKQILIDKKIIKFIVYRSERSFSNLRMIVNKLDKKSLITKKKINLSFVKELI